MVHWEEAKKQETVIDPWGYQARSTDIEQSAYVLLAMLAYGRSNAISDVVPIVRWLSKQRNSLGGWSSTQVRFCFFRLFFLFYKYLQNE